MANGIIKIVPTMMSLAVAANAYKLAKKKKKRAKDFVSTGTTSIVGTAMTAETAKFMGGF